ncbi:hypothetical protein D9M70_547680 [compost metagenome]
MEEPAPFCFSGESCPHSGYWQAVALAEDRFSRLRSGEIRRFTEGETLPTLLIRHHQARIWPLPDKEWGGETKVEWRMLGEA